MSPIIDTKSTFQEGNFDLNNIYEVSNQPIYSKQMLWRYAFTLQKEIYVKFPFPVPHLFGSVLPVLLQSTSNM
jgi:hypothetical protein